MTPAQAREAAGLTRKEAACAARISEVYLVLAFIALLHGAVFGVA